MSLLIGGSSFLFPSKTVAELGSTYLARDHFPGLAFCSDSSPPAPVYSFGGQWLILGTFVVISTDPELPGTDTRSLAMNFVTGIHTMGKPLSAALVTDLVTNARSSTATFFDSDGVLKAVAGNTLRINSNGLLVERQATNLLAQSDPSKWDNGSLTGTSNGATGLDGTMSGFLTALDSGKGQSNVVIPYDTELYTLTLWVRPVTPNAGQLFMPQAGMYYKFNNADDTTAYYDFATGQFGPGCKGRWNASQDGVWTKLTYQQWNDGEEKYMLAAIQNNPHYQFVIGNVQVVQGAYDLTPVMAADIEQVRAADAYLIPAASWKSDQGYITYDADDSVDVQLTDSGIAVSGWGYLRSIAYHLGVSPHANKMAGGLVMMNLSAAGFGDSSSTAQVPGVLGEHYEYATKDYYDRYKAEGITTFRISFLWERIQKVLNGPLDVDEVAVIKDRLDAAHSNGQYLVLDMHNYFGRWLPNGDGTNTYYQIGTPQVPEAAFIDAWTRIINLFKDHPGLGGWCYMNEPQGTDGAWAATAQKLVTLTDTLEGASPKQVNYKYINGDGYASTNDWLGQNVEYFPLKGRNILYEGHVYFDANAGGGYKDLTELVDENVGVQRVTPWVKWLETWGKKGVIGETGWPEAMSDATRTAAMNAAVTNTLSLLAGKSIPVMYFAGGPRWNSDHPLAIEYDGVFKGQISILRSVQKQISEFGPLTF